MDGGELKNPIFHHPGERREAAVLVLVPRELKHLSFNIRCQFLFCSYCFVQFLLYIINVLRNDKRF